MSVTNKIFDTNVQLVKYKVLKEVIRHAFAGDLESSRTGIAKEIAAGNKESMHCCIYKERAISEERVWMAMGGDRKNINPIAVIDIACDECPIDGMLVTSACRGCLMHACKDACPRDAISIVDKHAVIDKEKCIECGKCSQVCPYEAIITRHRPCIKSCKVKAISMDADRKAMINYDKCIACGACVYRCPFGAITDKSFVTDIIDMLKGSEGGKNYRVYAVIAPAIVSQFHFGRVSQVVTAIMEGEAADDHILLPVVRCVHRKEFPGTDEIHLLLRVADGGGGQAHQTLRSDGQSGLHRPVQFQEDGVPPSQDRRGHRQRPLV